MALVTALGQYDFIDKIKKHSKKVKQSLWFSDSGLCLIHQHLDELDSHIVFRPQEVLDAFEEWTYDELACKYPRLDKFTEDGTYLDEFFAGTNTEVIGFTDVGNIILKRNI